MDYLPLQGGYTIRQFCDGASKSSKNSRKSYVVKLELYKDTRVEDWWRHEFIVFTVVHPDGKGRSLLIFDRGRPEDPDVPQTLTQFVLAGFRGEPEDRLHFMEVHSDEIRRKVEHSARVLQVGIKPNCFNLFTLATIIKRGPYYGGYSSYHLFSANCWSWARGLTLDSALHQYKNIDAARLDTSGEAGSPMTAEELQMCMLTQYGAWGRLLLRLTSGSCPVALTKRSLTLLALTAEIMATSGDRKINGQQQSWYEVAYDCLDYRVERLRFLLARTVLYVYTVLGLFSRYRELLFGPMFWVTSFRRLSVHHDRTLDESGLNITRLPEGPNFRGFLPWRPTLDPILIQGLYVPGRYPLTFLTLSLGRAVTTSSIHIYVSTAFSGGSTGTQPFIRRDGAVKCSIMRKGEDGSLHEVDTPRNVELRAASYRGASTSPITNPSYYTGIARIDGSDGFAKQVMSGDTIVLWAEGRPDQVQHPRYASLKVITRKHKLGFLDLGFLAGFSFKVGALYQYLKLPPIVVALFLTLFYFVDSHIEDWVWSKLTIVANIVYTTSVPLPLPSDCDGTLDFTLPDFIGHCKKADDRILQSPVKAAALFRGVKQDMALSLVFEHAGARYQVIISVPKPKYDVWHYLSFATSFHRLEADTVKLSRLPDGDEVAEAERECRGDVVARIHFKSEAKFTLATIVDLLQTAEKRYWFHFWNNAKEWHWPWWFLRSIASPVYKDTVDFVRLDGDTYHSLEDASNLLSREWAEWRAALSHDYGKDMLKDIIFVVTRTRVVYLLAFASILQQILSPFTSSALNKLWSLAVR